MKKRTAQLNNNSGFTLVELIVVLVLMVILLSLTIFGGLAWQDWTRFKHENAVAEDIFFAAQNQLAELEAGGSVERIIMHPLKSGGSYDSCNGYNPNYVLAYSYNDKGTVYGNYDALADMKKSDGSAYDWDDIWEKAGNAAVVTGSNVDNSYAGRTIIKLIAKAGDYDKYLEQKANPSSGELSAGTMLLFDLIAPYLTDTSVLNGAIVLEFSPEAGQVFSVCFSDRIEELAYEATAGDIIDVRNREESVRRDVMMGYYGVDTLTERVKGKGILESNLILEIKNGKTLEFIVTETNTSTGALDPGKILFFKVYNGANNNDIEIMDFSFTIPENGSDALPTTMKQAGESPRTIEVNLKVGKYANEKQSFRIPVWKDNEGIHFIMDGADLQAATTAYVSAREGLNNSKEAEQFRNTYSFYKFGFGKDIQYIYASVAEGSGAKDAFSIRRVTTAPGFLAHKENINDNNTYGECTTFETAKNNVYTIANGRHFYNVRYETEYKKPTDPANTFKLTNNIDWNQFTGKTGDEDNYFLNSFDSKQGSTVKAGINYDGSSKATGGDGSSIDCDTVHVPFPGFRCLGLGDTFTQEEENVQNAYVISNLEISFAANIVYGVYDKHEDYGGCLSESLRKNCQNGNYDTVIGNVTFDADARKFSYETGYARAGKMPLGLFAENLGNISKIVLKNHVVRGVEEAEITSGGTYANADVIVATNMVGGFVGNNIGTMEQLTLGALQGDNSSVTGRTDVGGIVGRESFVDTSKKDVTLDKLYNYAKVTGLENVGGIIGRAYTHYVGEKDQETNFTGIVVNNVSYAYGTEEFYTMNPRYGEYHDGYEITDTGKSMNGVTVYRAHIISIQNCTNYGYVSGHDLYYNQNCTCAFIGGIAGVTMDGFTYDFNNMKKMVGVDGSKQYANNEILPFYQAKGYFDDKFSYMKVSNCASVFDDANNYIKSDLKNDPRAIHNNYTGGLVGYARLTRFEGCNTNPIDGRVGFILGNRYVGGVAGCSDMSLYIPKSGDTYATTNYNAVIGNRFVGGVAGAFAVGDVSQGEFTFREPSLNNASAPSQVKGIVNRYTAGGSSLNKGAVLGLKGTQYADKLNAHGVNNSSTAIWIDETPAGVHCAIGGVAGIIRCKIADCDNIQDPSTKNLVIRFATGDNYQTLEDFNDLDIEVIVSQIESSRFGGINVGGLIGYGMQNSNYDGRNRKSKVDAVVFGEERVGGLIGWADCSNGDQYTQIYPAKGLHVYGLDCVGGIIGTSFNGGKLTVDEGIKVPIVVKGRYAVGGVVGCINSNYDINASIGDIPDDETIRVEGLSYVGGYAGIVEKADFLTNNRTQTVRDILVEGKYFAGGIYGAMANGAKVKLAKGSVLLGDNVMVNAGSFAGGISGLYYDNNGYTFYSWDANGNPKGNLYSIITDHLLDGNHKLKSYRDGDNVPGKTIMLGLKVNATTERALDLSDIPGKADVSAYLHAGGLFGYVPDGVKLTVKGFNSTASGISTSGSITTDYETGTAAKYTYLGGIVGRIPKGMRVENCKNSAGTYQQSVSGMAYFGGLTEVNAGVIIGTSDTDRLTNTRNYEYSGFTGALGAFAGLNKGQIRYCQNNAKVASGGVAAGIAGETIGTVSPSIWDCVNIGEINGTTIAAGITGTVSPVKDQQGDDLIVLIQNCSNTGSISATGQDTAIAAGIVGRMMNKTQINNSANEGSITGLFSGGIVGETQGKVKVYQCENGEGGTVTGTRAGGIGSTIKGTTTIEECTNKAVIKTNAANGFAAGICAYAEEDDLKAIDGCVNYGDVLIDGDHDGAVTYGITCGSHINLTHNVAAKGYILTWDNTDPANPVPVVSYIIGPRETNPDEETEFEGNFYLLDDEQQRPVEASSGSGTGALGEDNPKEDQEESNDPVIDTNPEVSDLPEGTPLNEEGTKDEDASTDEEGSDEEEESEEEPGEESDMTKEDSEESGQDPEIDYFKPVQLVYEKVETIVREDDKDVIVVTYNLVAKDEKGRTKVYVEGLSSKPSGYSAELHNALKQMIQDLKED